MRIQSDNRRFFNLSGNFKHVQNFPTNLNSSEGVRRRAKPKTMDNYDLLSITIDNKFLKNAIRWPSQGLFQAIRSSVRRPLSTL
jgi:hypothetical protein